MKKTICLNMIVKNEKDTIVRCLESVLPIIDTWVIVDTGSTDGTQEIIKNYLKKIPGKLYERAWVDFAHNRQEALLLAKDKADYLLFMDADDILVFEKGFVMPALTEDFYAIKSVSGKQESWWFQRLVKSNFRWYWEGVVHEDLKCEDSLKGSPLEGIEYVYIHDGARAKDALTAEKDIALLRKGIEKEPGNSRYHFYLAQTYMQLNRYPQALEYYEKRVRMKEGYQEEIFHSKLMIARLKEALGCDSKTVDNSWFEAYSERPHRIEPLYYLSKRFSARGEAEKAYQTVHLALGLPKASGDFLQVDQWIYDWGLLLQLAVCAEQTNRFSEGIRACETLLKMAIPEEAKRQTEQIFDSLHKKNVAVIQEKVEQILR